MPRVACLGDDTLAVLPDVLEHEQDVVARDIPVALEERVHVTPVERRARRVIELGEVVVLAVDDDGAIADDACAKPRGWRAADGLREPKRDEADARHERHDDAQQAHLLVPRTLLLGRADACTGVERMKKKKMSGRWERGCCSPNVCSKKTGTQMVRQ